MERKVFVQIKKFHYEQAPKEKGICLQNFIY